MMLVYLKYYNHSTPINTKSAKKYATLAQLGERLPYTQKVTGSSPVGGTNFYQKTLSPAILYIVIDITRS